MVTMATNIFVVIFQIGTYEKCRMAVFSENMENIIFVAKYTCLESFQRQDYLHFQCFHTKMIRYMVAMATKCP